MRPDLLPPGGHGPQAQPQDPAKAAAARAFFDAALRQAGAPTQPAAPMAATSTAQPALRTAAVQPAEAPQKILRPGSLIDIRV
ncbi:MAG: hypothetical protein KF737_08885 [Phenylobacterium sp.]|nr:hypothetical protein [Phenylobacterium sp.]